MKTESVSAVRVQKTAYNKTNPISFKRNWTEHISWGANYLSETGKADFKMFTFLDAKKVFLEVAENTKAVTGGIKSRTKEILSSLATATGAVFLAKDNNSKLYEMNNKGEGIFDINNVEIKKDDKYRFVILDRHGKMQLVKDPYSKQQSDVNGWSEIYDKDGYKWQNLQWFKDDNPKRIKRNPDDNKFHGLSDLVIEEINIPTLSEDGTFDSAKQYIDGIAERGVANTIEIMPLENTFSLQWGYDGVDKFAVNSKMGGNDKLKEFVDYTHGKGLNVIIDMVPNHIGVDGDYLSVTGPYEKGSGPFGAKLNFEGQASKYVRDYVVNAALNWINEYKVDGLRLDLTSHCESDLFLKQVAKEVNYHNPDAFLIAEHGREGKGITEYTDEQLHNSHEEVINNIDREVESILNNSWYPHEISAGFDSKWDFDLMHNLLLNLLACNNNALNRLENSMKNAGFNIKYAQSHDEIGNLDGIRFVPRSIARTLNIYGLVDGNDMAETGQKAARVSQAINDYYIKHGNNITEDSLNMVAHNAGMSLSKKINLTDFKNAFNIAKAKQKLSLGAIFSIPGPKMFFQGDDRLHQEQFKFFRELSNNYAERKSYEYVQRIIKEKGYDTLESIARKDCIMDDTLNSIHMQDVTRYTKDLAKLSKNTESLRLGDIVGTYKDFENKVFIMHLKSKNDETLVFMNFGSGFHHTSYNYDTFPLGEWKEIINSDDKIYGGGGYSNALREGITRGNQNISLAPNSIAILKKSA